MHRDDSHGAPAQPPPGYTLMFAGRRTAKTGLLRLLLDTLDVAPSASAEQAEDVAHFVKTASQPTTEVRAVTLDVRSPATDGPLRLTLVDTPAIDFGAAPAALEASVADLVAYVEGQYRRSLLDRLPDHHVHLCVYLLDPDDLVPSRVRHSPRAKLDPSDADPPSVSSAELLVINRLAARVNVLPVIARADAIMSDRLEAIKKAVFKDLGREGLGFGIFDEGNMPRRHRESDPSVSRGAPTHYRAHSSSVTSVDASIPLLPYAVVTPDTYIWGDGVQRRTSNPPWDQLVRQYTHEDQAHDKMAPGRLTRRYRWGTLDVTDTKHCDFVPFREAIFSHMQALKSYTYEHLYGRWKSDAAPASLDKPLLSTPAHLSPQQPRHPVASLPFGTPTSIPASTPTAPAAPGSAIGTAAGANSPPNFAQYIPGTSQYNLATGVPKVRQKKILVACNFCRTRKLKCDGGRPACGQCIKRSNHCDYQPVLKRRGGGPKGKEEADGDDAGVLNASATATSPPQTAAADVHHSVPVIAGVKRPLSPTPSEDEQYDERPALPPILVGDPRDRIAMPVSQLVLAARSHPQLPRIQIPQAQHPQHLAHSSLGGGYGYEYDVDRERDRLALEERERERAYYEREQWDREREQRARLREWELVERERGRDMVPRHYAPSPPPISISDHAPHPGHRRTASLPGPHAIGAVASPVFHPRASSGMLLQSPIRTMPSSQLPLPAIRASSPTLDSAARADKVAMQLDKKKNGVRRSGSNYGPKTVACNFCRTRKTKCDGQQPKCGNCQKRNLGCEYLEDQRRRSSHMPKRAELEAPQSSAPADSSATEAQQRLKKLAPAPSQEAVSTASSSTSGCSPPMSFAHPSGAYDLPPFAKRKGEELLSPRLKRLRADSPLPQPPLSRMAIGEMMDDPRARRALTPVQAAGAW